MNQFKPIQLGDRARCPITGITGIVVCISTWLYGCIRISIQPEDAKDGKPAEIVTFDQLQLTLVAAAVHQPVILDLVPAPPAENRRSAGGPAREPADFRR